MTPFKDNISPESARRLGELILTVHPSFPLEAFVADASAQLPPLELKARVAAVAEALRRHLPQALPEALDVLAAAMPEEREPGPGEHSDGWHIWPAAHFVEAYGLPAFDASMTAMLAITRASTAEFAIRPFLASETARTLAVLEGWASHESAHVRRLVSEGSRPRLPWGQRLQPFIDDPSPTLRLLERLKDDPSEYVRRSVANHLNDVAKDHPERALDVAERWSRGASPERERLVRHALRTLTKQAHPRALALRGFTGGEALALTDLRLSAAAVSPGESLEVSFTLHNRSDAEQGDAEHKVVLHLEIDRPLARGRGARLLVWGELTLGAGEAREITRKISMTPVTTRTDYPGRHGLTIRGSGLPLGGAAFELLG